MKRAVSRGLGLGAALIMTVGTIFAAAPASAAEKDLGWLRLTPAKGTIDVAMDALSEKPCPADSSVVAKVSGPGVPTNRPLGNILGNTLLTTLPETETGQLYVPLQLTLRDWFGQNVPGLVPQGTYTISLICRDPVRSSETFGAFTAQVKITKAGAYAAVGEAAKPFDAQKASTDPITGEAIKPSASAEPSTQASSGATQSAAPAPDQPGASAEPDIDGESVASQAPVAAPAPGPAVESGSSLRTILLVAGAGLLLGALLLSLRSRSRSRDDIDPPRGAHSVGARDLVSAEDDHSRT